MKPSGFVLSILFMACGAACATVARTAAAEPSAAPAMPLTPPEHVARFALVVDEPRAALDECGGAAALQHAVERRLERSVFTDEGSSDASLVVSVERVSEARWEAHIGERDRAGTEVGHRDVLIDAEDCEKGIDTLAVVLAIMIGPPRRIPGPPPGASGPVASPPVAAREEQPLPPRRPEPPSPSPPAPPRRPKWHLDPSAAMIAGTGILPSVSWGLASAVALHPPTGRFSFMARAQVWPRREAGTRPAVELDRVSAALLACRSAAALDLAHLTFCAGLDGGRLHASASSIGGSPKAASRLLLDVPLEARVGFVLPSPGHGIRLEPFAAAELAVLLRRDRFTYESRGGEEITLHRAAPVALTGSVGLSVHFLP